MTKEDFEPATSPEEEVITTTFMLFPLLDLQAKISQDDNRLYIGTKGWIKQKVKQVSGKNILKTYRNKNLHNQKYRMEKMQTEKIQKIIIQKHINAEGKITEC